MRRRWLALIACSACLFPSLDGLSGGGGPDAAADVTNDVGSDAGDASADGAVEAAARFCAAHPAAAFCDDFDDAGTVSPAWTVVNAMGDASFSIVQDTPVSPPNNARSTIAVTTNSGEASVGRQVAVASGQTLSFGAALRADDWPAGPYASITSMYTDATHAVALVLGYNNKSPLLVIDAPGDAGSSTYPVTLPQSGWFRFTFVLAVSGGTSTIDLLIDGQTAVGGPKPGPPIFSNVTCYIGLYASDYAAPITWSFDDAYAEVK